ncbi:MAG: bifunctional phosphopantothenoylcysteine decarboxylase/phosphopantothenate--cysteine ligase CoaBC [Alphaproteobacteria bacterium]|nr:bifunctional phosphopantothenoylcysteine decarboxylase/phosphopantothenate--cysteine ligase CoaBC [Alphaproteobacteria bacterium]
MSSRILLIIAGGIAAYKSLEVIRRLRDQAIEVRCILTNAGVAFVTPLSVASLSGDKVFTDLFSLTDEAEMGHIQLSRDADLVVVAPATADLIGKMAGGLADDLASTALMATDKPVLIAPAMNPEMWQHPATRRNVRQVQEDGVRLVGPNQGDMACGEIGWGRMAEPDEIVAAVLSALESPLGPLSGRRALVTSGPTVEAIDPVRFLSNHSSGKQGHAVARALQRAGAEVTLVTGPVAEPDPDFVRMVKVTSAVDMLNACEQALPVDIAVCVAAVSDWRPADHRGQKIKKREGEAPPSIALVENPDILKTLSRPGPNRPRLVVGFAAETDDMSVNAQKKLNTKGCDWIVANNVSAEQNTFGGVHNTVQLICGDQDSETWPVLTKVAVAERLVDRIAEHLDKRLDVDVRT